MLNVIKNEQNEEGKQKSLNKIIINNNLEEDKAGVIYIKLKNNWNLEWQKIIEDTNYYAYCGKVTENNNGEYKVKNVKLDLNKGENNGII